MKWSALIAAAGESTRMGECKALLPFGDKTFVEELVDRFLESGIHDVWVTVPTGPDSKRVARLISTKANCIENRYAHLGLTGSIRTFLEPGKDIDGFILCPVDMPFVIPDLVLQLQNAVIQTASAIPALAALPEYEGKPGHPILLTQPLFHRFDSDALAGPQEVLASLGDRVARIPVHDDRILANINTPDVFRKWFSTRPKPS
jgi:molybdenum cofactor cytidylyltransferase